LTIIRVGNGWHEEFHRFTIATPAAAGLNQTNQDLDKPGRIKAASASVQAATINWNNSQCRIQVTLPAAANLTYGVYASQVGVAIYQFGAAAQDINVVLWLVIED